MLIPDDAASFDDGISLGSVISNTSFAFSDSDM
jgi:hypothetical protein